MLRRLAIRPKTQFTPIQSAPRDQQVREGTGGSWQRKGLDGYRENYDISLLSQARCLSGPSPQSCPEEPALTWVSAESLPMLSPRCEPEAQQLEAGGLSGKLPNSPTLPASLLSLLISVYGFSVRDLIPSS